MKQEYSIALDIGTNSVGWAVINQDYDLLKARKKNMWGVRLFSDGKSAAERRGYRSVRRRLRRRRERIELLRLLMEPMVLEKDPNFFIRLDDAFLHQEDKRQKEKYTLFNDKEFTDVDYHREYKTIYHLRKHLMETNEQADSRLIYLALHHIIKYRGHFIFEYQEFKKSDNSVDANIETLLVQLEERMGIILNREIDQIKNVLCDRTKTKKEKVETITVLWIKEKEDKKKITQLANALVDLQFDVSVLFEREDLELETKKFKFSDTKYDEQKDAIEAALEEDFAILELLQTIYSWSTLQEILNDCNTISDAMIAKYNKHDADLRKLKALFKQYFDKETYDKFFKCETEKNYAAYVQGEKLCTKEELYNALEKLFETAKDKLEGDINYEYCMKQMELDQFLPKINSRNNAVIPYQLNKSELEAIIDNQGRFYPELLEIKEKVIQLLTFRIPYYVGPLNHNNKNEFAWAIRKEAGKITPWTFDKIIDRDKSAEEFIVRMTNTCTYLPHEKVIPKNSLLYAEYEVLNELNKIKVNDGHGEEPITVQLKSKIYQEVFKEKRKVTKAYLEGWLKRTGEYKNPIISGMQKETEFASSLTAYHQFKGILGKVDESNQDMVEEIIYWLTVFEDKEIVKRKLKKYRDVLDDSQIKKIAKIRYTGWSRLSKKLLTGVKVENIKDNNRKVSIMDMLRSTNMNFMQIIHKEELGFDKAIKERMMEKGSDDSLDKKIKDLAGSPAIKKGIRQAMLIVDEITKVMGHESENIFLEFARSEEEKKRTVNRKTQLLKAYEKLKNETQEYNKGIVADLKKKEKELNNLRMYLYFCQNGKCLYTGETLDIDQLPAYQVDHILPQSYIKDDSIDNLALVKATENQRKLDSLLLDSKTINQNENGYWLYLKNAGLISAKKYKNLTRRSINVFEQQMFINRQLVETRQIIKHVAVLLEEQYQNSKIVTIKASLGTDFKEQFNIYKFREVNDYHHAADAYIVAVIGTYLLKKYPTYAKEFIYQDYSYYLSNVKRQEKKKDKYGFIISGLKYNQCDSDGVVCWNPETDIAKVKRILSYKQCNITKKVEEESGSFYKINPISASVLKGKGNPLKQNLDINKYGGYDGEQDAYFTAVSYFDSKKKKQLKKIVGIPILEAGKISSEADLKCYLEGKGYEKVEILRAKILKYQLIENDGSRQYIVAEHEVHNARQLILSETDSQYLHELFNEKSEWTSAEKHEAANGLYDSLQKKIESEFLMFAGIGEKLKEKKETFLSQELEVKKKVIHEILKITKANAQNGNLTDLGLASREGRKGSMTFKLEKIVFIDQSITGLYEKRKRL